MLFRSGASAPQLAGRRQGKSLDLPKRQETIVSGCARRGDSEHGLNELQKWVPTAATSADTRDGHETLRLLLQPPRSLCASTGHYPHLPSWELVQPTTATTEKQQITYKGSPIRLTADLSAETLQDRRKRQETVVTGCVRRGDSEHHLNEIQRWV